jgi:hypothetical protein
MMRLRGSSVVKAIVVEIELFTTLPGNVNHPTDLPLSRLSNAKIFNFETLQTLSVKLNYTLLQSWWLYSRAGIN